MPQIPVNLSAATAARVAHVIGVVDNLGHDASAAEVEAHIKNDLRALVIAIERQEAAIAPVD